MINRRPNTCAVSIRSGYLTYDLRNRLHNTPCKMILARAEVDFRYLKTLSLCALDTLPKHFSKLKDIWKIYSTTHLYFEKRLFRFYIPAVKYNMKNTLLGRHNISLSVFTLNTNSIGMYVYTHTSYTFK